MSQYDVEILSFNSINELPGSWTDADYLALLSKMDYENPEEIKPSELKEMCMMSLTDFEPGEAAQIVLQYLLGDELSSGQVENLGHQMTTEKLWEENPKLSLHQYFFSGTQLLHDAFNGTFPKTEAVDFQMKITGASAESMAIFGDNAAPSVVRLLAQGMSDRTLVNRLFGDQLESTKFDEATDMLWQLKIKEQDATTIVYDIVSSAYWFDDIKYADKFQANSHADEVSVEEED